MRPPPPSLARQICLFLAGRPLALSADDLPHPWRALVVAARVSPPDPQSRLRAVRRVLRALPLSDLDNLQDALVPVVLQSLHGPLTRRQREVYAAVLTLGPSQVRPIAEAAGQDRGHAHRRLQVLVKHGLLQRQNLEGAVFYRLPPFD